MPKLTAILIDPKEQTVSTVEIEPTLQAIYDQIGVSCFDLVRIGASDWIYVDDMGMYADERHYFAHLDYPTPLINKALIMGDQESTTLTEDEVRDKVIWRM